MTATSATAAPKRLRDLSDEQFRERYGADRFTASVLSSRFRYIIKHMCAHLMTNAFSPVLRGGTTSLRRSHRTRRAGCDARSGR